MFRVTLLAVLVKYKKKKGYVIFTKTSLLALFWLRNSTITRVVYTSYTSVLLSLRLYESKHILIPTRVEVEILQQAHTVKVKTVLCLWTVKIIVLLKMLLTPKYEPNLKLEMIPLFPWTSEPIEIFPPQHVPLETFQQQMLLKRWLSLRFDTVSNINTTCTSLHVVHCSLKRGTLILSAIGSMISH